MYSKISSRAFVAAVLFGVLQPVSAHVRFVDVVGNQNPSAHGEKLGHLSWIEVKDHGPGQYPAQWDTTVFSNPILPAVDWSPHKNFPRYWVDGTCGASLHSENVYYIANPHRDGVAWAPPHLDPHGQAMGDHRSLNFFMASIPVPAFLETAAETEQKALAGKMAEVTPGGWLEITTFQVNDDGAGPFRCRIDGTATGAHFGSWIEVINQPPGVKEHYSVHPATNAQTHKLRVKIPQDVKCEVKAGKYQNICVMRCENYAVNGPFGGCIPFNVVYPKKADAPVPKKIEKKPAKPVKGNPGYDVSENTYAEIDYGKGYRKRGLEQKKVRRESIAKEAQEED
ncbi:hypothetical protein TWF481_007922 [Arthrobotrys musiformis]|uniref:Uncharacterized protein n=1 Tax=Arthrobotrys musiformis TaxID=47236 RepID=A0AAV9W7M7_9PEZI